jgi:acetylornithine deacetylase
MEDVIQTLRELIQINSVNPAYEGGAPESGIAGYVRRFFAVRGIAVSEQEVFPGRPNVLAKVPGREPSQRVVLEAHMDTAGITGMDIPAFEPRVADGRVYGRGACDTKAGLAAMMHAVARVAADPGKARCEVLLAATADEEYSYRGVVKLCEGLQADAAVVAEPTSLRLVIATKGCVRFRILVRGKAAHSSKPHLGVNAVVRMARLIVALEEDAERLRANIHPLLGTATFNIGTVRGGAQVNIVPDACAIEIDRRLLPGEEPMQVWERYQFVIEGCSRTLPDLEAELEPPMLQDLPLETAPATRVVEVAAEVLVSLGLDAGRVGVPYGSDASKLARAGVPSVVFGPGSIDQAHAATEFVACDEVKQALEFYHRLLVAY